MASANQSTVQASTPATEATAQDSALAAWVAVFDAMEAAVEAAERALDDPLGILTSAGGNIAAAPAWSAPSLTGPLPVAVQHRARALAEAQDQVARRLEAARQDVVRQMNAVASVPGIGDRQGAVYLDLHG